MASESCATGPSPHRLPCRMPLGAPNLIGTQVGCGTTVSTGLGQRGLLDLPGELLKIAGQYADGQGYGGAPTPKYRRNG
jgi:hypothetical protein